jgi:hypothetical protein
MIRRSTDLAMPLARTSCGEPECSTVEEYALPVFLSICPRNTGASSARATLPFCSAFSSVGTALISLFFKANPSGQSSRDSSREESLDLQVIDDADDTSTSELKVMIHQK